MKKQIIGLSIVSALVLVLIVGLLFFKPNYSIEGKLVDITNKKPVADVSVISDGKETKTNKDGDYKIEKLKKETKISIKQPNQFEPFEEINISFKSRIKSETIKEDIELVPGLVEMEARTMEGVKYGQYDFNWDFMHPDDQAYWGSKEEYKDILKKRDDLSALLYSIKSYKVSDNIRVLPKWKHEVTDKEYENVSEVPVEETFGNDQVYNNTSHWIKVDKIWRYFTQVNKAELQKAISDYEKGINS